MHIRIILVLNKISVRSSTWIGTEIKDDDKKTVRYRDQRQQQQII